MKTYKTIDGNTHSEPENLQDRIFLVHKIENMLGVYSLIQNQTKEDTKSIILEIPQRFAKTIMYKKLVSK